jgi:RNA polymerase sigma factor (sigma-70 family)
MHEWDDSALLREYVERDSEAAFAALVTRHVNQVYSVALRRTGNAHAAEEITQTVFVILARKSRSLGRRVILSGWLYQTARLTAATFVRGEIRRARREQQAHRQTALNEPTDEVWPHIAPLLETAMAGLNETDRHAVVLRYFDGKNLKEVGAALGANEDAAKKRVQRAVDKLRRFFTQRGVLLPGAVLTAALSAHAVQAAPPALAQTVTAVAFAKGATAGGSTLTLIQGALKLMAWTKAKTAIVIGAGVLLATGSTWLVVQSAARWRDQRTTLQAEGILEYSVNGVPGAKKSFTAFSQSGRWLVHYPVQTNGIDYIEDACDGENIYRYTQLDRDKPSPTSHNSSTCMVEANNIPDFGHGSDHTTPIWLAYASADYFHGLTGNRMKSFFSVDRPDPSLGLGPYMEVEWRRSPNPPHVPVYIFFPKLNDRYQVLQFTNFNGLALPAEFLEEYFGPGRGTNGVPIVAMHGLLTGISSPSVVPDFKPRSDGRTYIEDGRFPGGSAEYTATNLYSTNSSQWRALLKMYNPQAGGLVWPRAGSPATAWPPGNTTP